MPLKEIFIVRHGERADKKDPSFSLRTMRPHDPPLTPNGVDMSEKLGRYLRSNYGLDPASVVLLSSPLVRCLQTSAGIIRGLCDTTSLNADSVAPSAKTNDSVTEPEPPLYIEPCLVESAKWQFIDMQRNPAVAREGFLQCPEPLWQLPTEMQATVSPHVRLERAYDLGVAPDISIQGEKLVEVDFDGRCRRAAAALIASESPVFADKTVICVSHGEASLTWYENIRTDPIHLDKESEELNPAFTAFVLLRKDGDGANGEGRWVEQLPAFATPHLPERPSEY